MKYSSLFSKVRKIVLKIDFSEDNSNSLFDFRELTSFLLWQKILDIHPNTCSLLPEFTARGYFPASL